MIHKYTTITILVLVFHLIFVLMISFPEMFPFSVGAQGTTTPDPSLGYKESEWITTKNQRWVEIKNLPNTLHEFRTVGRNDLGTGLWSDPVDERPLPGVLVGKRESSPFYNSGWFIVLIVIIVLLLLALAILVLVKKQRGAKYSGLYITTITIYN